MPCPAPARAPKIKPTPAPSRAAKTTDSTSESAADPEPVTARPAAAPAGKLPPVGPAWYPAAMGTGILATLLQTHHASIPGAHVLSLVVWVVAWVILISLTVGFVIRIARSHHALLVTLQEVAQAPMWGTVAMGFLAVGSATATVVPAWWPNLSHLAWNVDAVLWIIGTVVGVIAALGFGMRLVGSDLGAPTTVWGLAVVGPMVSATTGAALVPQITSPYGRAWLLIVAIACFFLSLFIGTIVFAVAYHHHWRIRPVPLIASCSAWIPLGMVGQSTAAAQAMAAQAAPMGHPDVALAVQQMANMYGYVMLTLGVPLVIWATVTTWRGFAGKMAFTPGWWALTFPIGTLSLGSHLLGVGAGSGLFLAAGVLATVVLTGTVTFCLVVSLREISRRGIHF